MTTYKQLSDYFVEITSQLNPKDFEFPIMRDYSMDFPDFIEKSLNDYIKFYENNVISIIDRTPMFKIGYADSVFTRIKQLSNGIIKVIDLYYQGKILEATIKFNNVLSQEIDFELIKPTMLRIHKKGFSFYRARICETGHLKDKDIFHIDFKNRHLVSTNRYSVPGFPALYFGDNAYVCWEEFNRPKLKTLWFSRFESTRDLKILSLRRYEDVLSSLQGESGNLQMAQLLSYLILFPLNISCSITVRHPSGNFKPEYIIPQLLLQFISQNEEIDGIRFPSTKIDYTKIHDLQSYNYVFPVKKITKTGFCEVLKEVFYLTQPTSLEIEEVMYNPYRPRNTHGFAQASVEKIELVNNVESSYNLTSFGKLETILQNREVNKLIS